ncbi:GNAT family N-acetyltransferase [soil metagenome]
MRFAIREAAVADAPGIAHVHSESWRVSYHGILPPTVLDRIDVGQRLASRERILRARAGLNLVAYDCSRGDIVGFCDAGRARGETQIDGEVYAIYFAHHAKRHGLGTEMFERTRDWMEARGMRSMIVWVLANNPHACRFYEAAGGRADRTKPTQVGGFPVIERAYVWDRI